MKYINEVIVLSFFLISIYYALMGDHLFSLLNLICGWAIYIGTNMK